MLKQRENGFQLYVNGVHNTPPPRSSSAMRQRAASSSHRIPAPSPSYASCTSPNVSNAIRRQWIPPVQMTIKTEQGSVITDIHSGLSNSSHQSKSAQHANATNNQLTYRLASPPRVDQSWMPDWYTTGKPNKENSDRDHTLRE
jgi:hypothetical protein